ncbi:hypothetical protein ACWEK5_51040, partial [Rhodococcus koreensis]
EALTVAARRGAVAPLGSGDGIRTGTTAGSVRRGAERDGPGSVAGVVQRATAALVDGANSA